MANSLPLALHPLTAQEEIYWLLNFQRPIHPVLAAHITGRTEPDQWRAALDQLQQRHPLLSVSIEPSRPGAPGSFQTFFQQQTGAPIPLRVVSLASVDRWEAEIEREVATPFLFCCATFFDSWAASRLRSSHSLAR